MIASEAVFRREKFVTSARVERLLAVLVFLLVLLMAVRSPLDTDMWWHLKAGAETLHDFSPLTIDRFSYTVIGERWINHSWLSQVMMFLLFRSGGLAGISLWMGVTAAVAMLLVYLQTPGGPFFRAALVIMGSMVAAPVWTPRPQIFSFLLFSLTAYILFLYKWKQVDRLFLFPLIFLLWGNLHGGYVLGLLLLIAFITGELFDQWFFAREIDNKVSKWKEILRVTVVLFISVLVLLINPNGISTWLIPFQTVSVSVLQDYIPEWGSPNFHNINEMPFLFALLLVLLSLGLAKRRVTGYELIALILFCALSLMARRNFGPFALVVVPILGRNFVAFYQQQKENLQNNRSYWSRFSRRITTDRKAVPVWLQNLLNGMIITLLAGLVIAKMIYVTSPGVYGVAERQAFPVDAIEWMSQNQPPGNLFNNYDWGGYLIWNLPQYPVFVDGRTDLFDDKLLRQYLDVLLGKENWEKILDEYHIGVVILDPQVPLVDDLARSEVWRRVDVDPTAALFIRDW